MTDMLSERGVFMMKRIFTGILLLSIAVLVLGACSKDSSKGNAEQKNKEDMVATVNGEGLSLIHI